MVGNTYKPMNGLWTSSERDDGESAWLDLCRDESRKDISAIEVHRFEVIGEPKIWVLKNDEQLIEAALELNLLPEWINRPYWEEYGEFSSRVQLDNWVNDRMKILLDCGEFWGEFNSIADAVHTPANAEFSNTWMSSFEVESTCWFKPERHLRRLSVRPWP